MLWGKLTVGCELISQPADTAPQKSLPSISLGAKIGGGLARVAANALEMETLEAEDREFEGAKNFVRICGEAAKKALATTAPNTNPTAVAQKAVASVVAKHAPGLMRRPVGKPMGRQAAIMSGPGRGQSGRWVRKGNSIILLNAA
jgi:hypothetical protein